MERNNSMTKDNLLRAFAGESQARNRYEFAAGVCRKKGLEVLELLFTYTAGQEREHGKIFYQQLQQAGCENIVISAGYPVDLTEEPLRLLQLAAEHENDEFGDIYPAFAEKAREEGFPQIAAAFQSIAAVEKVHAERFARFARLLEEGRLFAGEAETEWICLNCGNVYKGPQAPGRCPVCDHSQGYFIRLELSPFQR